MKDSCLRKCLSFIVVIIITLQVSHYFIQYRDFTLSVKGESVFGNIQEISIDSGTETQSYTDIAINGNKIHVVWQQEQGYKIYYRYYDGNDWNPPRVISNESMSSYRYEPAIAVDGDKVHVVWHESQGSDFDIYYCCYNGSEWLPEIEISDDTSTEHQWWSKVAASNGQVHVVWCDEGGGDKDIIYRRFNGVSWESEIELNTDTIQSSEEFPDIYAQGNEVYAVWDEYEPTNTHIYYRHFNGAVWESEQKLLGEGYEKRPRIAVNGSRIYIVLGDSEVDSVGDIHMFYHNGVSWEPEKVVASGNGNRQRYHNVAANSECAHIVWEDRADGTFDIFYRSFNGTDFSPIQEIDQEVGGEQHYKPAVAAVNEKIYVVWEDQRDGDSDIYITNGTSVPLIIETTPSMNEINVEVKPNITINFTHQMNTSSVEEAFSFTDGVTIWTKLDGTFNWTDNNRSCSFVPQLNLNYLTNYSVVINATAKDIYGKTIDGNKNGIAESFPEDNYYWNFTTIFSPILLEPGWNLISLYKLQSTTNPKDIFVSIEEKYDSLQWYNSSDPIDPWEHYHAHKPTILNDLRQINHSMGIWIHINDSNGAEFFDYSEEFSVNQSILLYPGWNLVGYPSSRNRNRAEALGNLNFGSEVDSIWTYNATIQKWEEIGPSDYFEVGRGYYIHSKVKKAWDVPL